MRHCQPSTQYGMGNEPVQMRLLRPYTTSRASANEFGNVGPGSSTQVPPPISYVGLPTLQPPGGVSETTADAAYQTATEEEGVPVSYLYCPQIPRVTESVSGVR